MGEAFGQVGRRGGRVQGGQVAGGLGLKRRQVDEQGRTVEPVGGEKAKLRG
ncbi:hypothetical protein ABZ780_02605 [Micromonospora sp. NPDC047467]|uniref:hypothetical protein n=1 Tax=Micromonospora sp. NPDC047467 TaxID=3154814 RepID=UPI0033EE88E1